MAQVAGLAEVLEEPAAGGGAEGLLDTEEVAIGTHLLNPDTDGDGATDGAELAAGSDPLSGAPEGLLVPVPSLPAWGWVLLAIALIAAGASGTGLFVVSAGV